MGTHLGDPSKGPALWPNVRHVVNYPFWGKMWHSLIPDIVLNFVVDSPIGLCRGVGPQPMVGKYTLGTGLKGLHGRIAAGMS